MGRAHATSRGRRRDARDTRDVGDGVGSGPRRARAQADVTPRASVEETARPGAARARRLGDPGAGTDGEGGSTGTPASTSAEVHPLPRRPPSRRRRTATAREDPSRTSPPAEGRAGCAEPRAVATRTVAPWGTAARTSTPRGCATRRKRRLRRRPTPPRGTRTPHRVPRTFPASSSRGPPRPPRRRRRRRQPRRLPRRPPPLHRPPRPHPSSHLHVDPLPNLHLPRPPRPPPPPPRAPNSAAAPVNPGVGPGADGARRQGGLRGPSRDVALRRPPSAPRAPYPPSRAVAAASRDPAVPAWALRQVTGGSSVFSVLRHPRAAPEFAQGRPPVGGARGGCGEATVGADARPRANPNRRVRGNGPEVDVPRTVRGVPRGGARDVGFARSRRRRGLDGIREVAVGNVGGERRRRGKRRRRGASPTKAATPNDGEAVSAVRAHDPGFENQARTPRATNLRIYAKRRAKVASDNPSSRGSHAPFHAVRSAAGTFLPGTRIDIPPVGGRGDATSERRRAPTIRARRPLDAHPPSPLARVSRFTPRPAPPSPRAPRHLPFRPRWFHHRSVLARGRRRRGSRRRGRRAPRRGARRRTAPGVDPGAPAAPLPPPIPRDV